mmetsp:Transcript_26295/g.61337  ORF Transcript_26295/g.61337 Transcript_26295/m.61337 type:complete len:137 (-) Transcript_26295:49-459(-)
MAGHGASATCRVRCAAALASTALLLLGLLAWPHPSVPVAEVPGGPKAVQKDELHEDPHDCSGLYSELQAWSWTKKSWCCKHEKVGCERPKDVWIALGIMGLVLIAAALLFIVWCAWIMLQHGRSACWAGGHSYQAS